MQLKLNRKARDGMFNGRFLPRGAYFGMDEKGTFVATYVLRRDNNRFMRLYRLDLNRGWCPVWESSETTVAIRRRMVQDNPSVHFKYELDVTGAEHNALAQVHNPSRAIVF